MILHLASASPHRRIVGLLLCAMLLTQLLGLLHGVVHAAGPLQAMHRLAATPPEHSALESLFAHHDSVADCQVFDQLSQADAPLFARLDLGLEHPALLRLGARPMPPVAAAPAGVPARGPPVRG
jgi:hypothetical protein